MSSPISGFTAIPNPQMLAFMPIQSYLMMYFAGGGWQIGKRKISAIPNDKFNKMSAKDLLQDFTADLKSTIPTLESSLNDITPLIRVLIEQYGEFVKEIIAASPDAFKIAFGDTGTQAQIGFDKLFHRIEDMLKNAFPSLPSAGAVHDVPHVHDPALDIPSGPDLDKDSTIAGLTVAQAMADAKLKQDIQDEKDRAFKAGVTPPKAIAPIKPFGTIGTKKKAGQSQYMARKEFIAKIANAAHNMRQQTLPARVKHFQTIMELWQQRLVDLLSRYYF